MCRGKPPSVQYPPDPSRLSLSNRSWLDDAPSANTAWATALINAKLNAIQCIQWWRLKPCSSYGSVLDHDVVLVLRPEVSLLLLCCQDVFHLPHHAVYCSVRSRRMFKRWFIFALWVFVCAYKTHYAWEQIVANSKFSDLSIPVSSFTSICSITSFFLCRHSANFGDELETYFEKVNSELSLSSKNY